MVDIVMLTCKLISTLQVLVKNFRRLLPAGSPLDGFNSRPFFYVNREVEIRITSGKLFVSWENSVMTTPLVGLCVALRAVAPLRALWLGTVFPQAARRFGRLHGVTIISHSVRCRFATDVSPAGRIMLLTAVYV